MSWLRCWGCQSLLWIVETGTTLKENGLEVIEDIAQISARLIVNPASAKLRQQEIDFIIGKLEEAKQ